MSSSYVVKYTMNGDSQRSLRWKTYRPQSTRVEFIMTIYVCSLFLKKKKENHPPQKKQESPTQINNK